MGQANRKTRDTAALTNDLLRFDIDKTHQSLFEAGKLLGTAFITYLSLLLLTLLLIYGKNVEDSVSVPLLGLKVNKDLAAAITLLLCQIVQIWLISLFVLTTSLTESLNELLLERYERTSTESWYMLYPSPFHSIQFLIEILPGKQSTLVKWLVYLGYSAVVAFLPYYLSTVIGSRPNFPPALKEPWVWTNTFLNLSVSVAMLGTALYVLRAPRQFAARARMKTLSELRDLKDEMAQLQESISETKNVAEKLEKEPD